MNVNNNNLIKIILILFFISFSFALYYLNGIIAGYKLSIYDNLPFLSFFTLIILNLLGFFITIGCYKKKNNLWKISLTLILLINFIIITLPYLTGYSYSSYGDHLTHIGYIKDILNVGYLNSAFQGNVYPITHIIGLDLYLFSGVSFDTIAMFLGPIFYFLFVISTYIFVRKIYPGSEFYALLTSIMLFCFFYKDIYVMGFAFLTIPIILFILYNYYEKDNSTYAILLIIYLILMPFLHPVVALILTAILGLLVIINNLINIYKNSSSKYNIPPTLALFALIVATTWIMQTTWLWHTSVSNVFGWLNLEMLSTSMLESASENFSKVGLNLQDILILFIKVYGPIFLFSIISSFVAIKTILKNDLSSKRNRFLILFSYIMVFSVFLWLLDLVSPVTLLESGRMEWLLISLMPLFVGIFFNTFINDISKKIHIIREMKFILIVLIFGVSSLLVIFSLYPSPYTYQFNTAISNSEITGADWIFNYSDNHIKLLGAGIANPYRYENALNGTLKTDYNRWSGLVNEHFGYNNFSEMGDNFTERKYMMLRSDFLISIYSGVYKKIDKFNEEDFSRLNNDESVFKIYENGEMETWYINPKLSEGL